VEQNIFTLLINLATVYYGGKYLERAWSSAEFGKFILVVSLISNVVAFFLYVFWAAVTESSNASYVYYLHVLPQCFVADSILHISFTAICGGVALQAGFLVAFKQLVPEHTVTILKGIIKMRVKHFPALFLLINTLSGPLFGTDTAVILAWLGLLTGWTYLRFYKRQPQLSGTSTGGAGIRGDASETFAFAYFFPDVIQGLIAVVSEAIYNLLVTLKICTPFSAEDVATGNEQASARGEGGLPSLLNGAGRGGRGMGKREEAERRRALALKALDQRLHAASANKARQPPVPTVTPGQSMLGETNYTPDHDEGGARP
jgi:hypothetical protein